MSSSQSDNDMSSSSIVDPNSGPNNSEEEDFLNEQPRKRRRLTPPTEKIPKANGQRTIEPTLSRIRAKNHGLQPNTITSTDSVNAALQGREKTSFASLDVKPWLVASLANMAITRPTGIQKGCIPEILKGRDCIGGSRTGSGKTVAFAVPMLQKWAEDRKVTFKYK
jgi:ATP-dependent RNA helicase DDX49/DBP8